MDSCARRARRDKVKQAWRVQRALTKNILHCRYTFKCICKYILIYWKTFCLANSEIFFFSNWAALKYVPRNPLFKHQYFPAPPYCWIHCLHKSGNLWKVFALHFKTEHSLSSQYIQHWLKGLREAQKNKNWDHVGKIHVQYVCRHGWKQIKAVTHPKQLTGNLRKQMISDQCKWFSLKYCYFLALDFFTESSDFLQFSMKTKLSQDFLDFPDSHQLQLDPFELAQPFDPVLLCKISPWKRQSYKHLLHKS